MKWSPSLRTKVVFAALACIVLLGFALTLATLRAVQERKRVIVSRAQELVEGRAQELSRRLGELGQNGGASDPEALLQDERFKQIFRAVVRKEDSVLVYIVIGQTQDGPTYLIRRGAGDDLEVEVETLDPPGHPEARRPLQYAGRPTGDVVVKYAPEALFKRIQEESRQITVWLIALAGMLTVLLIATFLLLWRIFQRHLEREHIHEQLDRMAYVGTLASGLAHEIRNPLNALSLNLDIVGEELEEPQPDSAARTRRILGVLKAEIGRLNATVTNFLQFAIPRSPEFRMTDLVAVLSETASLLQPDMRKHGVAYRFVGDRSCVTLADPAGLRQVFWNVLLNAIEALENCDRRQIEIRLRVGDGACRMEIRDSGPGIPPDQREQVFAVFHSRRSGGSGFGLAIARQVVERHGGSIRIDSLDGWGCVVQIDLPLRVGETVAENEAEGQ